MITVYGCPATTDVVGSFTVWVVDPVSTCTPASPVLSVRVPPDVAVELRPTTTLLAKMLPFVSRRTAVNGA